MELDAVAEVESLRRCSVEGFVDVEGIVALHELDEGDLVSVVVQVSLHGIRRSWEI